MFLSSPNVQICKGSHSASEFLFRFFENHLRIHFLRWHSSDYHDLKIVRAFFQYDQMVRSSYSVLLTSLLLLLMAITPVILKNVFDSLLCPLCYRVIGMFSQKFHPCFF